MRKGMIYLSFGNQSESIYTSYVLAVCRYMEEAWGLRVRIINFISIRGYWKVRRDRKRLYSNALFLPMAPGMQRWRLNVFILGIVWLFWGKAKVMALSPIAGNLALTLKKWGLIKTLIYDSEGAVSAEWNEYDVVQAPQLKKEIFQIERKAVMKSDFRRAVSQKMVDFWQEQFLYQDTRHVVIPCTISPLFDLPLANAASLETRRSSFGYELDDIIFVYAGSSAQCNIMKSISKGSISQS